MIIALKLIMQIKNFGNKKLWYSGTQNMFGRESIGGLIIQKKIKVK